MIRQKLRHRITVHRSMKEAYMHGMVAGGFLTFVCLLIFTMGFSLLGKYKIF